MGPLILGLLVITTAALLAGGIALLQQRVSPPQNREGYNEVAGSVFEIISVLYAIVLAFVLIAVWEDYAEAREVTYTEAHQLVEIYWAAQVLPDDDRQEVRRLCRQYAEHVISTEWPNMDRQHRVDPDGWHLVDRIRAPFNDMDLSDEVDLGVRSDAHSQIRALQDARSQRLDTVDRGLPTVMWLVLLAGAVLMFGVLLLFGTPGRMAHLIVVTISAAMVSLLLFSVYQLEYPFSRGTTVQPEAFHDALDRFDKID